MEPKLIFEEKLKCPICGKNTLIAKDYLYESKNTGKLILSNWVCSNCSYNYRDVKPYETYTPKKIELKIENENDLNTLVYRSAFASMFIPELDVEVTPMAGSQGIISTVEGLIEAIIDNLGSLCDENNCKSLYKAKNGELTFTLIIEDPSGLSFIKSEKAKITQLLSLSPS